MAIYVVAETTEMSKIMEEGEGQRDTERAPTKKEYSDWNMKRKRVWCHGRRVRGKLRYEELAQWLILWILVRIKPDQSLWDEAI